MDEKLKKFAGRLLETWKSFSRKKKTIIIGSAAAVVILIVVIFAVSNIKQYELLYNCTTQSKAASIYSSIKGKGYLVKVDGNSIFVEKGKAASIRMELAEEGVPQTNLSYDIYSSGNSWAETDKDKQIKYVQQIQNRDQDSIQTIPGVNQAIVTIAMSDNDTYVLESDKTDTTASVKLTLDDGVTLTKKQVAGIISIVSGSVSGLKKENVSVVDSDGTPLSGQDNGTDITSDNFVLENSYAKAASQQVKSMLEKIYGTGNVLVDAHANIDFSSTNTVTTSYASSGTPTQESKTSQYASNGSGAASGQTGVSGAVTYPASSSSANGNVSTNSTVSTAYAVGSIQQQVKNAGGTVKKLSVAVVLNSRDPSAATADVASLKQAIAAAVGASVDDISISQMRFSSSSSSSSTSSGFSLITLVKSGNLLYVLIAAALVLLLILGLLIVLMRGHSKKRKKEEEAEALAQAEQESQQIDPSTGERKPLPPVKSIEESIAESQNNTVKRQIEDFAEKKPELVAQILKNWLKD